LSFINPLGEVLFEDGWSLGPLSNYVGPQTESRLIRDTGYDDTTRRLEMCLESLSTAKVISRQEYVSTLSEAMNPDAAYADPSIQPAPRVEAVLPSGKTVELGEKSNAWHRPTI